MSNTVVTQVTDEVPNGPGPSIAREFAGWCGSYCDFRLFSGLAPLIAAAETGDWDVALLAREAERSDRFLFSKPYLTVAAALAVRGDVDEFTYSRLDAAAVRIAVSGSAAYVPSLRRQLPRAQILRCPTPDEALALLYDGQVEAAAGLRPALRQLAESGDQLRILEPPFHTVLHAMAARRSCPAMAAAFDAFAQAKPHAFLKHIDQNGEI